MKGAGDPMASIPGPYTGCDLSNVTSLCMPWRMKNGVLSPDFSRDAMRLSLELAAAAYDMQMEPWRQAGWVDVSYLVDDVLLTGSAVNGYTEKGQSDTLMDSYQRRAQSLVKRQNPIAQLLGAWRQMDGSDTCKCLIMLHQAPGRGYVVALGFMGTGKRVFDWISNFRMEQEENMHRGFLELTKVFEKYCPQIEFPETARELGVEKLTLTDVLTECRRPGSRFRLWMAGHSQGGAMMQCAAFREIRKGLLRQNVIGYGFASPTLLYANPGCDLSSFPLHHILNGDDAVPRVGARLHVGRCYVCQPDHIMRRRCYGDAWQQPSFRAALHMVEQISGSRQGLLCMTSLLSALEKLPDSEAAVILNKTVGKLLPDKVLTMLGGRANQFLRYLIRHAQNAYERVYGRHSWPQGEAGRYEKRIAALMAAYGPQEAARAIFQVMGLSHKLRSTREGVPAAYQYIVNQRSGELRPYAFCGSVPRFSQLPLRHGRTLPSARLRPALHTKDTERSTQ